MRLLYLFLLPCLLAAADPAASSPPPPAGGVSISGSLRTRLESWDWFQGDAANQYNYGGAVLRLNLSRTSRTFDWQLDFALPVLFGLPDDAVAPGDQGPFGYGANYYLANGRHTFSAMLFAKQGYLRFRGAHGQALKIGRMEVSDAVTVTPRSPTLATIKRDRVSNA